MRVIWEGQQGDTKPTERFRDDRRIMQNGDRFGEYHLNHETGAWMFYRWLPYEFGEWLLGIIDKETKQ